MDSETSTSSSLNLIHSLMTIWIYFLILNLLRSIHRSLALIQHIQPLSTPLSSLFIHTHIQSELMSSASPAASYQSSRSVSTPYHITGPPRSFTHGSSANSPPPPPPSFVQPIHERHHRSLMHGARFDLGGLQAAYPPKGWNAHEPNKELVWKLIQEERKKAQEGASSSTTVTKTDSNQAQRPTRSSTTASTTSTASSTSALSQTSSNHKPSHHNKNKLLRFARYNSSTIPMDVTVLKSAITEFQVAKNVYAYETPDDPAECHWFVNFADKHLFGFYGSSLFAQDEWQCLEHPTLCSLREYLDDRSEVEPTANPLTVTKLVTGTEPTPCLIMNAPREVSIDAVGGNIYGNNFSVAPKKRILASTTVLSPPTYSNIIAMEAVKHGRGLYTQNQIFITLQTAIGAFTAAKAEANQEYHDTQHYVKEPVVVVHTGNWGCGAFGGNIELMCLIQLLAARISGIDRVIYHVLSAENEQQCAKAVKALDHVLSGGREGVIPTDLDTLSKLLSDMGYRWGFSNGT